ncbi:MAG: hypothetical protein ACM3N9_05410 [Syntrophothermus sp.]
MYKKNAFWVGIVVGILLPVAIFAGCYLLNLLTGMLSRPPLELTWKKIAFASVALNILPIRYYFTKDMEESAKGLLFITVVLIIMVVFAF